MTTERQRRANRLNAMKSTGPRTAEGKKRSSQNSRKHGLVSAIADERVDQWLDIILGIEPHELDFREPDGAFCAALDLAEAEARLEEAQRFEEYHELVTYFGGPEPPPEETEIIRRLVPEMEGALDTREWSREDWGVGMALLKLVETERKKRELEFERLTRLSRRYRREAESQRNAALKRWLAAHNPETNPISS